MSLFDLGLKLVTKAVLLPVSVIYDAITMGGACTERKEPMTVSVIKSIVRDVEEEISEGSK